MKLQYQVTKEIRFFSRKNSICFPLHINNSVEVLVINKGECTAICEQKAFHMAEGDLFVSFPNQIHRFEGSANVERHQAIIPVTPFLHAFHATLTQNVPASCVLKKGHWETSGLKDLLAAAIEDPLNDSIPVRQGYALLIVAKLLALLDLQPIHAGPSDALRLILVYVNAHYKERITCADIAKAVCYHESYVSRVFKKALKVSLFDYIHSLRIADAQQLLLRTKLSIAQIGMDLGFGSIRNFNRVFLQKTGMTPKAYRKSRGGQEP